MERKILIAGWGMPGLGGCSTFAVHFLRNLRGGSQPVLIEASDGQLYVLKFNGNAQGTNLAINEAIGTELFRACRLPVTTWKPILVTGEFLDRYPGCWPIGPAGPLRPQPGLCFASQFVGDGSPVYEILPGTRFGRVANREDFWVAWLIDICAHHTDNRQALFVECADKRLQTVFIDHGHMFDGATGRDRFHFMAPKYLDARVYPPVNVKFRLKLSNMAKGFDFRPVWRALEELPEEWKTDSGAQNVANCLERLSNPPVLEETLDTMGFQCPEALEHAPTAPSFAKSAACKVLHSCLCSERSAGGAAA